MADTGRPALTKWQIICPMPPHGKQPEDCSWCLGTGYASIYLAGEVEAALSRLTAEHQKHVEFLREELDRKVAEMAELTKRLIEMGEVNKSRFAANVKLQNQIATLTARLSAQERP